MPFEFHGTIHCPKCGEEDNDVVPYDQGLEPLEFRHRCSSCDHEFKAIGESLHIEPEAYKVKPKRVRIKKKKRRKEPA